MGAKPSSSVERALSTGKISLCIGKTLQIRDDVRINQDRYSLLYVPHPFVIPGGRFREFYYW